MRTKRKTYKYDSSDYDNDDYGQDDYEGEDDDQEEEDQYGEESGDGGSDYDQSQEDGRAGRSNQKEGRASATTKTRRQAEQEEEESYEDEDPFSPEIDQILHDKVVEVPNAIPQQMTVQRGRPTLHQPKPKIENWYLVKFVGLSYLHIKWMEETQLEEYSYRAKQKIRRYLNQKEKKRLISEQMSRQAITFKDAKNHHFSEDDEEEEDEDAAIKGIPLVSLPIVPEEIQDPVLATRPTYIKVEADDGEDLTQYFDKGSVTVERILSTTILFPVIHPRQAKQIKGKWQDDCLKVVSVIANFRKNNVPIGLAFSEQLDPDNDELTDYFKVVKLPIDLTMIMNRLYNKQLYPINYYRMYQEPNEFWNDLGLVFKNCRSYYKNTKKGLRKQCDALRTLAYHLYNDWYYEMQTRFKTGVAVIPTPPQPQQLKQDQAPPIQAPSHMMSQSDQTKDSTIVNLQSLLKSQQNQIERQNNANLTQSPDSQAVNKINSNMQSDSQGLQRMGLGMLTPQQQVNLPGIQGGSTYQMPQTQQLQQFQQPTQAQPVPNFSNPHGSSMGSDQMQQQQFGMNSQGTQQFMGQQTPNLGAGQQQNFQNQSLQNQMMQPGIPASQADLWNQMQKQQQQLPGQMGLRTQQSFGQTINPQAMQTGQTGMNPYNQLGMASLQGMTPQQQMELMQMNPQVFQQMMQGLPGQQPSMQQLMGGQGQMDMMGQMGQQQLDWMKGGSVDKLRSQGSQLMGSGAGMQGMNQYSLTQAPPGTIDQSAGIHLPSFGQIQQNLMQNPFMAGQLGQGPGQMSSDMQTIQALQQQERQLQMMTQGLGLGGQGAGLIGPGGQFMDMMNPHLPSMNQISQLSQPGMLQLPSISQLGALGGGMNPLDPFGNQMLGLLQGGPGNQAYMNQMFGLNGGKGFNQSSMSTGIPGYGSISAMDELSMLMPGMQNQLLSSAFNPFGNQIGGMGDPSGFGMQLPSIHQTGLFGQNPSFNPLGGMGQLPSISSIQSKGHVMSQIPPLRQKTIVDPNLVQPDNLDQYNDKQQDPPVPPCIMDPGRYDLSWLLEPGEDPNSIVQSQYLTQEEIDETISQKHFVDQLFLVKWKTLSYSQQSWEPESILKPLFEEKIQDYIKFNRSLDQTQREKLDQLIKNHKKMLRITEKKYQSQGKRNDQAQEQMFSLQEAKLNRQLLNQKIVEVMGENYFQLVQYNYKQGIVPQFKKPNQVLKDYQVIGLNWLIRAWHENRNIVLADEMGLGKTIMTLSLFDHLSKFGKLRGPYLILAPLTTLEHWKRIADEWTNLNSVLYYDPSSSEGRAEIRNWEWYYTDVTYKGTITQKSELYKFNIIITSFEVFMQDLNPILQEIPFIYIVVDEAHRLKNKQAKTLKLLKDHPCKRILLLTGTPVQNNTKELWTLLNYIEPEKFNSLDEFLNEYGNLETFEQIQRLHTMLKPHFLRRLKEEVDNTIPPLQETVIEVGLTTLQNTYYKGIYGENRMVLAKFGTNSIKTSQLNNMDVQLRKCCNHLFLLKGVEEELTRECKDEQDIYQKLLESSGKLMLLDKFIEKFKEENHKMLIFSQFKRMLDIIELYLRMKRVPYEKLTGSVKTADRISAIQRFNDDKTFGVFLLTTRAGGLGINLTSARVVIIFDSDWNPQNDLQAIARAHRIGQKFEVQVYRLITSKTYEEQMFERASKKLGMEQALFSKGAFHQDDDIELSALHLRGITDLKQDSKEIENLLKYGAYAFIDQEGEQDDQVNKDIDEILATGKKKEFTYSKGLYTLQKSTFNASKYEKLPDVNDPDFWDKVMPFESIISISVLEKRFKKEKKEMGKNDKVQKEFFKDLEIVFNDFMDAKFDVKTNAAGRKSLESDEEKLREILKKIIKLTGMKLGYVEKCKEWLRDMLRTNKRKKPDQKQPQVDMDENEVFGDDDDDQGVEEDDIIMDDSEDIPANRNLRKRQPSGQIRQQESQLTNQLPKKRGRKPKIKNLQKSSTQLDGVEGEDEGDVYGDEEEGEMEEYDEEDEEYGDEEVKGNPQHQLGSRQQYRQQDDDDDEPEARYGLRGRKKRQKTGKEEFVLTQAQATQLGMTSQQLKQIQKMNDMMTKRNEKNGIVCSHCLHPETFQNPCNYFCRGYCQRYFHEACKEQLFFKQQQLVGAQRLVWQCDDCQNNVASCFCCKEKGIILLFPKKGKPKAAGSIDQPTQAGVDIDVEIDEEDNPEDYEDDALDDENELMPPQIQPDEEIKEGQAIVNGGTPQRDQNQEGQDIDPLDQDLEGEVAQLKSPKLEQTPSKIVISIAKQSESSQLTDVKKDDLNNRPESPENKTSSDPNEPDPNDDRYVVRCTLGGCFKYYHVKCVYKNKNVSCINSMKVQRFRCPLHYCEFCLASGDSVLIVQCVLCPIAYHLKCLSLDQKAIRLTKKYIICGKHNKQQEDFPKYEEKNQLSYQKSSQGFGIPTIEDLGDKDPKKKKPKKRGRKPKNKLMTQQNQDSDEEPQLPRSAQMIADTHAPILPPQDPKIPKQPSTTSLPQPIGAPSSGFTIKLGGHPLTHANFAHSSLGGSSSGTQSIDQRQFSSQQQSSTFGGNGSTRMPSGQSRGVPKILFSVERNAKRSDN